MEEPSECAFETRAKRRLLVAALRDRHLVRGGNDSFVLVTEDAFGLVLSVPYSYWLRLCAVLWFPGGMRLRRGALPIKSAATLVLNSFGVERQRILTKNIRYKRTSAG